MFELLKLSRASSQRHCVYSVLLHVSCRFEAQLPQFKLIGSADMLDSVLLDNGAILKDLVIIGATGTYKLVLSSKIAASNDASTDVTNIEPAFTTKGLIHQVQGLSVQLKDASNINLVANSANQHVELQCNPNTIQRAWREHDGETTANSHVQRALWSPVTQSYVFESFWLSVTAATDDITAEHDGVTVELPVKVIEVGAGNRQTEIEAYKLQMLVKPSEQRVIDIRLSASIFNESVVTVELINESKQVMTGDYSASLLCKLVSVTDATVTHTVTVNNMATCAIAELLQQPCVCPGQYKLVCEYTEYRQHVIQLLPQSQLLAITQQYNQQFTKAAAAVDTTPDRKPTSSLNSMPSRSSSKRVSFDGSSIFGNDDVGDSSSSSSSKQRDSENALDHGDSGDSGDSDNDDAGGSADDIQQQQQQQQQQDKADAPTQRVQHSQGDVQQDTEQTTQQQQQQQRQSSSRPKRKAADSSSSSGG
eukprot:8050-Heterococcus_DN1.PRE.2